MIPAAGIAVGLLVSLALVGIFKRVFSNWSEISVALIVASCCAAIILMVPFLTFQLVPPKPDMSGLDTIAVSIIAAIASPVITIPASLAMMRRA